MAFSGVELYRPAFEPWLLALVGVVIGLAVVWLYGAIERGSHPLRRTAALVCRGAGLAGLLWVLAGPSVMESLSPTPRRPAVVVLADTSASMAERDVAANAVGGDDLEPEGGRVTRWEAVARTWLAPEYLDALRRDADVSVYRFDQALASWRPRQGEDGAQEPTGEQTRLFDALREASVGAGGRDRSPLVLVLSDGHDTSGAVDGRLLAELTRSGRRVFAVPVGEAMTRRDVVLHAWAEADYLFDGQATTIRASVLQSGFDGREVELELHEGGRLIERRRVRLSGASGAEASFRVRPEAQPGAPMTLVDYEVRVRLADSDGGGDEHGSIADADDEEPTGNNRRSVFVQVSRQRIRVALFEGEPYWDTRYLAQVLRDDPRVELTAVYRLGPGRVVRVLDEAAPAEPIDPASLTQAALNEYDVVVLGRGVEHFFPGERAAMLADYVEQRGGALVMARGRPVSGEGEAVERARAILSRLEPVRWGEEAVRELELSVTPQGAQAPVLSFEGAGPAERVLTRLPGMIAATKIARERAASAVWLRQRPSDGRTPAMAAVVHLRLGRGQVFAVLTDGLWRWSLLPSRLAEYDTVFAQFWTRAIRWLATGGEFLPGQEVSLTLDRLTASPGETVRTMIHTRFVDAEAFEPSVRVVGPEGEDRTLAATRPDPKAPTWVATFEPTQSGIHRVELVTRDGEGPRDDAPAVSPTAPALRLAVYDRSIETLDTSARPDVLRQITDATGGLCFGLDERDRLREHLERIVEARRVEDEPRYDFARPPVFALIVAAFGVEWLLRRRGGMW